MVASRLWAAERLTLNFNPDWKFIKADPPGAAEPAFDDRAWTIVCAPHTFNDSDTFDDWSLSGHRGEQNQWSGRTWYRKAFRAPDSFKGRKVLIEFEAVRQVAEVYLNGKLLGIAKTGFTPFGFDLTPELRFDRPNVLAVMCDNRFMKDPWPADGANDENTGRPGPKLSELAALFNAQIPDDLDALRADQIPWNNPHWHPAHGGIYRNVFLHVMDPLHISLPLYSFLQTAGPYAYATDVSPASARVTIEIPIENGRDSDATVEAVVALYEQTGKLALQLRETNTVAAGTHRLFTLAGSLSHPKLWEPAYPEVYRVLCSLRVHGSLVDTTQVPLGIRTVRWDTQTGFYINGHHLKLHGWGQRPTQEWPGIGAALPDWVQFFTLQLMKDAGGNFIRWGHCAGAPAALTAADKLGIITDQPGVDGESDTRAAAWELRASAFRDTLIYFRNHPSILLWEGGNQKVSRAHATQLRSLMDQYDPHGGRAYTHRRADKVTAEFMEVSLGTEGSHEAPQLPVVEAEYDREESPRRVWDNQSPPRFGYPEAKGQAYQLTSEQCAVNQIAQFMHKVGAPQHCGGANWLFSDSTSGGRVACEVARTSGEVDGVRLPKEAYYVCQVMFRADPQVHIIGHWTYPPGTRKTVYVAANGDAVELFLNDKSLGRGAVSERYLFTFPEVVWGPGELKAVCYAKGKAIASDTRRTAGPPVALRLTPLTGPGGFEADGSDLAFLDVEAVDARGERCPTFEEPVKFELAGPAVWLGGYNSGRTNTIHQAELRLECGINRVAIRAAHVPGSITVSALCEGLIPGHITLSSGSCNIAEGLTAELPQMPEVSLPANGFEPAAADTMPLPIRTTDRAERR